MEFVEIHVIVGEMLSATSKIIALFVPVKRVMREIPTLVVIQVTKTILINSTQAYCLLCKRTDELMDGNIFLINFQLDVAPTLNVTRTRLV